MCCCVECLENEWCLTDREVDVLVQIATGRTNEETADALDLSVHTVVRHVSNMQQRSGAPNRVWLISRAYCAGVLLTNVWPPVASRVRCVPSRLRCAEVPGIGCGYR